MPDKLTDSEIVKALDICSKSNNGCSYSKYSCKDCCLNGQPMCSSVLIQDTIDLIDRLQAENERLKATVDSFNDIGKLYSEIKAEAYKEFAERLKIFVIPQKANGYTREIVLKRDIDNLLKKLVGEDNESKNK